MTIPTQNDIENALRALPDPYLGIDWISQRALKSARIAANGDVVLELRLGYPHAGCLGLLTHLAADALRGVPGIGQVRIESSLDVTSHAVQKNLKPMAGVKNIIAVASGKGGVGKSTTSVNLALALAAEGARVGLLDADIYGPSQPLMLGLFGKPDTDGKAILPKVAYGIESMSIGYLIDEDTPMVWRGPMVTGALQQLLNETRWGGLDYLVIDLPPGTGDIQLTLSQQIPVSGAVIVTTPQDIALMDAQRGLKMFEKVGVPVLGIVENMSTHICSQCGHEEPIFGAGGGVRMAERYGVELLGSLPLDISIRENADNGHPTVIADPDGAIAGIYKEIARKAAGRLARRARDYSSRFPSIVVQNT